MTIDQPIPKPPRTSNKLALESWIRALDYTHRLPQEPGTTLISVLESVARTHPDSPALEGEAEQFTYRQLISRVNRYARWAIAVGLGPGDVVALLLMNRPDYIAAWLGLSRAGCVVALINTNMVADGLLHSIRTAEASHLIAGASLLQAVEAVAHDLPPGLRVWVHGGTSDQPAWQPIEPMLQDSGAKPVDETERPMPVQHDRALLIYTSGTTGLPKAANVTHGRIIEWSLWFAGMMNAEPDDRLYDCLPLYHSTGGIVAVGAMLVRGGAVVIRERFSASRFREDIAATGCTIFQYIGELCRFLIAAPPHPQERSHRLRLACGNGLQGDVWTVFQQRFGIPRILEFYAATEGVVSLYNCEGKPGAVGRVPQFLAHRFPVALIRVDAGEPVRDENGLCIACAVDEAGEAIGTIPKSHDSPAAHSLPAQRFDGYTDAGASSRKLLRDVFEPGDVWYRTGDLLRKDSAGYFSFVDRAGDTFRWRGENVSATEVATVVRACPGVTDAVVFGVAVPGNEGRAGMAAVTVTAGFDWPVLRRYLTERLPPYAQPLFVRICQTLDMTGTFKLTKGRLMGEGYDGGTEPVWFHDRHAGLFVPVDAALLAAIREGGGRL